MTTCIRVGFSQTKNDLPSVGLVDELKRMIKDGIVNRLHVVLDPGHGMRRKRALIFDLLFADLTPAWIDCGIVGGRRPSVE